MYIQYIYYKQSVGKSFFFFQILLCNKSKTRVKLVLTLMKCFKPIDLGSNCLLWLNFITQAICYVFILPSKLSFAFMKQYWSPPVAKLIILRNGVQVLPTRLISFFFPIKN